MPRNLLSAYLNQAINLLLVILVVLIPLFFAPFTTDFFEIPKLILLSLGVLLLLLLISLSWIVSGRVLITRTPLDLPLLLLLVIILLATFISDTKYISILGNLPRVHGGTASWIAYILFYFIASSSVKTKEQVRNLIYALIISSLVVALVSLASYFGFYLMVPFAKFAGFNPTGATFSAAALLALLLPIPLLSIINPNRYLPRAVAIVAASIYILTIVLIGTWSVWAATLVGIVLLILTQRKNLEEQKDRLMSSNPAPATVVESFMFEEAPGEKIKGIWNIKNLGVLGQVLSWVVLIVPVVCLVVILASFIPIGKLNPIYAARANFTNFKDVQLPFSDSWKISVSSFRDAPFLGTGPGTYLFNFTQYKPIEFNNTKFWNLRFDTSFNEFLQILGTLGGLGLLAFIFFTAIALTFSLRNIIYPREKDDVLSLGLSLAALVGTILLILHSSSLVFMVVFLALLAMMMNLNKATGKVEEVAIGIKTSRYTDSNLVTGDALPIVLFVPIVIFVIYVAWNSVSIITADYYHRLALNLAATQPIQTYNYLIQAERENPNVDLYRVDLAQTNFVLANAIAVNKGPNEASPGGSLTDQDKQNIQTLLSQSITEGRASTLLSPRNSANWEVLGSIYRQITGVAQNAFQFSLDAYGRAIARDPLNPMLRLSVGGIYYSVKNYDLAIRFFTDAINLKPDYANAYYNLAIVLKDKGDFANAQQVAARTVSLLDSKSADYQVASNLLADLKNNFTFLSQ